MSTLKLNKISEIKTEKERTDGKVSRQYYTATFSNPSNPFSKTVSRVFWQQHNVEGTEATWKAGDPKEVKQFIGKTIPGQIVSSKVEAYDITDTLGTTREANTYTAVVLEGELPETVFKAAGKVLLETAPSPAMVAADEDDAKPF